MKFSFQNWLPNNPYLKWALTIVCLSYVCTHVFAAFVLGPYDYDHLSAYYELAWRYWASASFPPQYNPFLCGGRTLGADPQIPIFNPIVLLVPILGPIVLLRLELLAQLLLGTYGLYQCLKRWKLAEENCWLGVFIYVAGGAVLARFLVGHVTLGFFLLFPWILYLSYRLIDSKGAARNKTLLLFCLTFIYCGSYKPNFLIYGGPLLFIEAFFRSLGCRSIRPLAYLAIAAISCAGVNAVSYLPSYFYFSQFPRQDGAIPQWIPPYALIANWFMPLKSIPKAFYGPGFLQRHEYNIFIGPIFLYFLWKGLRTPVGSFRAERVALFMLLLFSMLLGFGSPSSDFSLALPYSWFLPVWPGFESIRVPTRFWYGVYLVSIIYICLGFRTPSKKWQLGLLAMLGYLPLVINATTNLAKTVVRAESTQFTHARTYRDSIELKKDHPDKAYQFIKQGYGQLDCTDNVEIYKSPYLIEGNTLTITAPDTVSATAQWLDWSHIKISASGPAPYRLSLNLNHSPLWAGPSVVLDSEFRENLAIKVTQNSFDVVLEFRQPWVREGFWISIGSILLLVTSFLCLQYRSNKLC